MNLNITLIRTSLLDTVSRLRCSSLSFGEATDPTGILQLLYSTEGFKGRPTTETAVMVTKLKVLMCILLSLLTFAETGYGQGDCHCPAVVYLQRGMEGKIPCQCIDFSLVSWYRSEEDYDNGGTPFINYDNSETTGPGKISGEFDVGVTGSLIITNVSMMNHGMTYFCVFLRAAKGLTERNRVKVEVLVPSNPPFPVVNGYVNQQHLNLDLKRKGSLHCDMKGVHPRVNLSFTLINQHGSGSFPLEQGDLKYTQNEDNTYDVTVTSNYTADFSVQTVIIQCGVIDELRQLFPEITTAEISFPPAYPIVNGGVDHEHVYLEMNRTGELNCNIASPDLETRLDWMVMDPSFEDTISFHNCIIKYLPRDGIFIVFLKCSYIVKDETVDRVTVRCQVTGSTSEKYPNATIVELLFPRKAISLPTPTLLTPVIDKCNSKQDLCMLRVQSKGELTCRVKNIHQLVDLKWNIFDEHQWEGDFSWKTHVSNNIRDGTFDISSTLHYAVKHSHRILIAECFIANDTEGRNREAVSRVVLDIEWGDESASDCQERTSLALEILIFIVLLVFFISWCFDKVTRMRWKKHGPHHGIVWRRKNHPNGDATVPSKNNSGSRFMENTQNSKEIDEENSLVQLAVDGE